MTVFRSTINCANRLHHTNFCCHEKVLMLVLDSKLQHKYFGAEHQEQLSQQKKTVGTGTKKYELLPVSLGRISKAALG